MAVATTSPLPDEETEPQGLTDTGNLQSGSTAPLPHHAPHQDWLTLELPFLQFRTSVR